MGPHPHQHLPALYPEDQPGCDQPWRHGRRGWRGAGAADRPQGHWRPGGQWALSGRGSLQCLHWRQQGHPHWRLPQLCCHGEGLSDGRPWAHRAAGPVLWGLPQQGLWLLRHLGCRLQRWPAAHALLQPLQLHSQSEHALWRWVVHLQVWRHQPGPGAGGCECHLWPHWRHWGLLLYAQRACCGPHCGGPLRRPAHARHLCPAWRCAGPEHVGHWRPQRRSGHALPGRQWGGDPHLWRHQPGCCPVGPSGAAHAPELECLLHAHSGWRPGRR